MQIDERTFYRYLKGTEIVRSYYGDLSIFSDTDLPYVFAAEHPIGGRVSVIKGTIEVYRPQIIEITNESQCINDTQLGIPPTRTSIYFNYEMPILPHFK